MMFLGVLCLAACALAQPTVYVSRTSLEPSVVYYYPFESALQDVAIVAEPEKAEVIVSAIPETPLLSIPIIETAELKLEKESDEFKKEEDSEEPKKDEEDKEAEPKALLVADEVDPMKPVIMRFSPPQFITNFISSLPVSISNWPFFGSMIPKPPTGEPAPAPAPVETVRYRVRYVYPSELKLREPVIEQL